MVGSSLKTGFDQVERVADYDACCTAYVAGPEVGGHLRDEKGAIICFENESAGEEFGEDDLGWGRYRMDLWGWGRG
jgi:hypothetical protein